jgi:hypothetical protein
MRDKIHLAKVITVIALNSTWIKVDAAAEDVANDPSQ